MSSCNVKVTIEIVMKCIIINSSLIKVGAAV